MLFVETNNFRQQETLQQEFVRQGNLFAIPFSKSKQIAVVLKNILFQVFQLEGSQKKPQQNNSQRYGLQLAMKITNFISNLLKLKFSLSAIREIFQTIKAQNSRLSMYQQYFNQMNEYFTEFNEYQCSFTRNKNFIPDKESQQQNQLLRKDSSKNIHLDLDGFQFQNQKTQKQILKTPTKHRISLSSGVIDSQESLIGHSLQSQIFKSPRFTITRLQQLKQSSLNSNDNNDNSFQEQNYTSNLKDEILTNNSVRSSNYCSPFKIESFKNLLQNDNSNNSQLTQKKKDLDKSKYIQDLQGLVNPIPSFLHDEQNLRQMIAKQKKQDIRKSKIIRQQITKIETQSQVSTNTNDKVYYSSYRSIKLNNKLRRSSKKSIPKKDIEQLDNQVQSESKLAKQRIKFVENQLIQNRNQQFFNFLQKQMGDNIKKSKASDTNKEKVKIYSFFKSKKG